jgi:hypothetical protein
MLTMSRNQMTKISARHIRAGAQVRRGACDSIPGIDSGSREPQIASRATEFDYQKLNSRSVTRLLAKFGLPTAQFSDWIEPKYRYLGARQWGA